LITALRIPPGSAPKQIDDVQLHHSKRTDLPNTNTMAAGIIKNLFAKLRYNNEQPSNMFTTLISIISSHQNYRSQNQSAAVTKASK
jgi:hypothetical protein